MQKIVVDVITGVQTIVDLTPEEIAAAQAAADAQAAAEAAYVPQTVPLWAVRTVLQTNNLFTQADAAITASNNNALINLWQYGNYADRGSAAITSLATTLNLTSAQVDQMFRDANNLSI